MACAFVSTTQTSSFIPLAYLIIAHERARRIVSTASTLCSTTVRACHIYIFICSHVHQKTLAENTSTAIAVQCCPRLAIVERKKILSDICTKPFSVTSGLLLSCLLISYKQTTLQTEDCQGIFWRGGDASLVRQCTPVRLHGGQFLAFGRSWTTCELGLEPGGSCGLRVSTCVCTRARVDV